MPQRIHAAPNATFFRISHGTPRGVPLFSRPSDYRAFLSILDQGLGRHDGSLRLVTYCLMPNRWHLVLGPTDTADASRLAEWVTLTHEAHRRGSPIAPESGFSYPGRHEARSIEGPALLMHVCRDVERHALVAQLVRRAQDWPWSGLADRMHPGAIRLLVSAPFLTSKAWVDHVNAPWAGDEARVRTGQRRASLDDFAESPGGLA